MSIPSYNHETAVLSDFSSAEEITLEALVRSPAYACESKQRNVLGVADGGGATTEEDSRPFLVNQEDTFYDGHIVRVELLRPTLMSESYLVLDILGPNWDRVFRCEFQEVKEISQAKCQQAFQMAEIHKMELQRVDDGFYTCEFGTWVEGQYLRIKFRTSKVTRLMLKEKLSRETLSSD